MSKRRRPPRRLLAALAVMLVAAGFAVAGPATPAAAGGNWRQVAGGYNSTCGIKSNQSLWCWGDNTYGKLGLGDQGSNTNRLRPTEVSKPDIITQEGNVTVIRVQHYGSWEQVSVGRSHTCGVVRANSAIGEDNDATGYCWGSNLSHSQSNPQPNGKLGLGAGVHHQLRPTPVPGNWQSISAGYDHTCGIRSNGILYCWGANSSGQLGLGDTTARSTPTRVNTIGWLSVSAGQAHTCGVTFAHSIYCWGRTASGQVGTGIASTQANPSPKVLTPGYVDRPGSSTVSWDAVSAGGSHTCAIDMRDIIWCWGENGSGQLGQGHTSDRATPQTLSGSAGDNEDWTVITAGQSSSCGIRSGGASYCWGNNAYGQLGLGDTTQRLYATRLFSSGGSSGDAGYRHTCGILTTGSLYCWGWNFRGQLGLGHTNDRLTPNSV